MSMMSLDTARQVIRRHNAGQRVDYADFAAAGAVVYANHMRARGRSARLTYDAAPTRMRDQPASIPRSLAGNVTEGGAFPESGSGPVRVQRLYGPASAYQILTDAEGQTWLCRSSDVDGALDPGTVTGDDRLKRIRSNDAAQSRSRLAEMNERNKAFWSLRRHGA
jgi:hypothetical protein